MDLDRTFLDQFNPQFERINRELGHSLGDHVDLIMDIGRHALLGEGKRLRPLLFVLSSQLCGYNREEVYHLSTMFEYLHAASLIHDDVLDNAEIRRKKPSVRHVWGNLAAVLGGDYLYSKAGAIAIGFGNLQLIKLLNDTTTRMVEGQFLELENTHNWRLNKTEYMEIITSKTAVLMSMSCASGAIVAGSDEETFEHLSQFGLHLGIAFQLIDDILDYTSSEEDFGKPVGKDLREGKITLPLLYTLSNLEEAEGKRWEERFRKGTATDEDYRKLITLVRENGAIEKVRSEAGDQVEEAAASLRLFSESSVKTDMLALNRYIIERHF